MHIQSMRKCIYLCISNAQMHGSPAAQGFGGFIKAKKNPPIGGLI
jgi:hypothetical protein